MSADPVVLPGTSLGPLSQNTPGAGTHVASSTLFASLAGPIVTEKSRTKGFKSSKVVSIPRPPPATISSVPQTSSILPEVDSIVLAKVTRLQQRQATVEILVIYDGMDANGQILGEGRLCPHGFGGIIRSQDVRATEKDRVKISESFVVGDIVRGIVISLGDQSSYYMSTAKNEFGVIMAHSEAGNLMHPISWKEFRDPVTGKREIRKVAKPF